LTLGDFVMIPTHDSSLNALDFLPISSISTQNK
jgi:hypothetical protein